MLLQGRVVQGWRCPGGDGDSPQHPLGVRIWSQQEGCGRGGRRMLKGCTTGRCFTDQPSLRKPGMSQLWKVFSPLRWASVGESGGHRSSQGWLTPMAHR